MMVIKKVLMFIGVLGLALVVVLIVGFILVDPSVKLINTTEHQVRVSVRQGPRGNALYGEVEPFGEYSFSPNSDHGFYLFVSKSNEHFQNCKYEFESCCDPEKTSCKESGSLHSVGIKNIYYSLNNPLKIE